MERIIIRHSIEACKDADLVIEAVYENFSLKAEIFRQLDKIAAAKRIPNQGWNLEIDEGLETELRHGEGCSTQRIK